MSSEPERISKRIARAGICSRRDAERLIAKGQVKLNGNVIDSPVHIVTDADAIEVEGTLIGSPAPTCLWLYHKPRGLVVSHKDPEGRPTVFDALPATLPRVVSVGRLDLDSEGLLLLTNSGELARHLELPANGWARRYRVRIHGMPHQDQLRQIKKGITIDGIDYRGVKFEPEEKQTDGKNIWAIVTLEEGKNREIRRIFEHLGHPVSRLIRTSYGPFQLGTLASAEVKLVPEHALKNALGKGFKL